MEYSFAIFNKNSDRLAMILAENCRKRRLDKGMSRRSLSEATGIPEPTLERFEIIDEILSVCRVELDKEKLAVPLPQNLKHLNYGTRKNIGTFANYFDNLKLGPTAPNRGSGGSHCLR